MDRDSSVIEWTLFNRVVTFICLLISIIVLATNTTTSKGNIDFTNFVSYHCMLASGVIGIVYTAIQIAFTIYEMSSGNRFGGTLFDFCGDMILSYLLLAGGAIGFVPTVDLMRFSRNHDLGAEGFINNAALAATWLLSGFVISVALSIYSLFSFQKRELSDDYCLA